MPGTSSINIKQNISLCLAQIAYISYFLFLIYKGVEGPVRYLLVNNGLEWLQYFPTFFLLFSVFIKLFTTIITWRVRGLVLVILLILSVLVIQGALIIENIVQVFFGIYILIPFLFGVVFANDLVKIIKKRLVILGILWGIIVLGVFLDFFIDFPWTGFNYKIGDITIEVSRAWTALGIERLAGFSRASFEAAIMIFIIMLILITHLDNYFVKNVIWLISGMAIFLTTTKGIILVFFIISLIIFLRSLLPQLMLRLIPYLGMFIMIFLPLYSWHFESSLSLDSYFAKFVFSSFEDRLLNTWPNAYQMILQYGWCFMGRGIGGIGAPQQRFELLLYNPADNLFVYLYAIMGYFSIVVLVLLVYRTIQFVNKKEKVDKFFYLYGVSLIIYGITTNVIESVYMCLFLGVFVTASSTKSIKSCNSERYIRGKFESSFGYERIFKRGA